LYDIWLSLQVAETKDQKVTFKSNLFGNFGAGLFVPPNTIDFNTVFDDFGGKILENLPVFLTVCGIILLYIPLVIICRRYDKKDKLKVTPVFQTLPYMLEYLNERCHEFNSLY
jgi:hypothetical protein